MIRLLLLLCCLCFPLLSFAANKPCADVDPRNAGQVKSCISRSQSLTGLDGAGKDFSGCNQIRMLFAQEAGIKSWGQGADPEALPSCGVVSKVLSDMNGNAPVWAGCAEYVDQGRDLNACIGSLKKAGSVGGAKPASCPEMKQGLRAVELKMLGRERGAAPDCMTIAKVLEQNRLRLFAYECRAYEPDNQTHINRCLHSVLRDQGYVPHAANLTCDQLRLQYKQAVASIYDSKNMHNPEGPANFQTATCAMMEQAVASLDASHSNQALASGSGEPAIQASGHEEAVPVRHKDAQQERREAHARVAQESASVEEPVSLGGLLKQQVGERVSQSESATEAQQQLEEYEALTNEEELANEEEEVTLDSVEEEAKKKMKKKLFDKLGL